ncbi:MAG TPA: methionyl-tRNA formyltransferase [Bacteroidota bacterium]|nr:methionyl-tRNA formyltransferase [Bacteroidota bacterium]
MRIVFMGTPEFAVPSIRTLLEHRYDIVAVVTAPDKPRGRGQQLSFTPVKEFALQRQLPVLQPENLHDEVFISQLQNLKPDLIIVVAFRILPKEIFLLPRFGTFNLHASLLPKYRGAAPINWAIIHGDRETGVTTFFLQEKVDTGNILMQARIPISQDATAGEIHDALSLLGANAVLHTVQMIESGTIDPQPQNNDLTTPAPKIFKDDCRITWQAPAEKIHNFVRGLSPHPAAWTTHKHKTIKLFKTSLVENHAAQPGIVLQCTSDSLIVGTQKNALAILEIQQEGRKKMSIAEFLRGYRLSAGDVLE